MSNLSGNMIKMSALLSVVSWSVVIAIFSEELPDLGDTKSWIIGMTPAVPGVETKGGNSNIQIQRLPPSAALRLPPRFFGQMAFSLALAIIFGERNPRWGVTGGSNFNFQVISNRRWP